MRLATLSSIVLLAGCASAPPPESVEWAPPERTEPAPAPASIPPTVSIPSVWPAPGAVTLGRCPSCGSPVPLLFPSPFLAPPPQKPPPVLDEKKALRRASVNGRYRVLLRKIEVPDDWRSYGAFCDWGFWKGTSYAGADDLPPGHWVYVHPHWYVWQEREGKPAVR